MSNNVCPQCGAPIEPGAIQCKYCGEKLIQEDTNNVVYKQTSAFRQQEQPVFEQITYNNYDDGIDPSWPKKSKVVAGLLAIFLGVFGIHKFYLGNTKMGIIYLLFFWTYIPACIGFIEGIVYFVSSDRKFQITHKVRLE